MLAERAGLPADDPRPVIQAAMFDAALRAAVEHHVWHTTEPAPDATASRAELEPMPRTALMWRRALSRSR
ncbi:hypothetical protein [Streptomyces sp. NPDC003635]